VLLLRLQSEWTQVSNNVRPGGNFVVLDLDPASWYHLRVTAHNNAGFSVAEYEFASLTLSGGKSFFSICPFFQNRLLTRWRLISTWNNFFELKIL